jgi:hypothetical protein
MAATLPKRFEPFVVPGGLKGQISELPVPEVLQHLRLSQSTGILTLVSGGARKALYLKDGRVVFASSNLPNDRLGEILLREGKITVEEYEASIKAITKGKRQGKVLVEMGALSPKDLWEGVQTQVREIVFSIFMWEEGQFHFEESTLPDKEKITVDLDVTNLILEGVRRVDANGAITGRYPRARSCPSAWARRPPECSSPTRSTSSSSSTASGASSRSARTARSATTRRSRCSTPSSAPGSCGSRARR